ncbi:uncharacterized protein LOC112047712 [Bicyclus anynana]|uniref:Uncharacterized protein LOC112047712 n=1 Tax=Bicyclus anynana TaxID=110368 RepID=A0A6J1N6H2_BICAN|nr:uncharacterized protein LOC112047712 [Bicyclus anynana]
MEEPVSNVRQSTRNLLKLSRRLHRDEENDLRRSLKATSITSEDIARIASKLKTKSAVTVAELRTLENGLMDDAKHIQVFLSVHGSLRGLVRELTGVHADKQCAAAACCCNLALGDVRTCTTLAKAAGSYLVAALDNLMLELAVTCAWTLGNLAGSGDKVSHILTAQGALSKLSDHHTSEEMQDAAVYALLHFTQQMKDDLKEDHLQLILNALSKLELTASSSQLLFILSCHDHFVQNMSQELLGKVLTHLPNVIDMHNKQTKICYDLIYIVRVLANCDSKYEIILNYCVCNNIFNDLKYILSRKNLVVNDSLLWLIGNLYMCCGDDNLFLKLLT